MKIYTRTGDKGKTGLADSSRISKASSRIQVLGDLDEANAHIGLIAANLPQDDATRDRLLSAQSWLFNCGARLADPCGEATGNVALPGLDSVREYEVAIDDCSAQTPPLRQFVLPGGTELAALAHVARSVVRRAERSVVLLQDSGEEVPQEVLMFLNRLSDYLFALARFYNHKSGRADIPWSSGQ